jgi:hypothetical protein
MGDGPMGDGPMGDGPVGEEDHKSRRLDAGIVTTAAMEILWFAAEELKRRAEPSVTA